jgi:nucleoside-diphosphate-sugar epimerase
MSKLIVVLGATGTQGGSVVNTFLDLPGWKIRALTRNANSAAAQKLKDKGVHEVVSATLDDVASLVEAFKGAHTVFSVTDFWGMYYDPANSDKAAATGQPKNVWAAKREEQQGKNVFDAAAKTEGLERLIFSGLSNATKWSKGKYPHVYHFDSKAHAAEYGQAKYPDLWAKTSVLQVGFYLSNLITYPFMRPQKVRRGVRCLQAFVSLASCR